MISLQLVRKRLLLIFCLFVASFSFAQSWQPVGPDDFTDPSIASGAELDMKLDNAGYPVLAFLDNGDNWKASVLHWDGSSWIPYGTQAISSNNVNYLSLVIDANGYPIVAYTDPDYFGRATVKRWNGSSWSTVGNPGFTVNSAYYPSVQVDNLNNPVVAFSDDSQGGKATVMKWDGSNWVLIGGAGFTATGASMISMQLDGNQYPVVAYQNSSSQKAVVARWDGVAWSQVGDEISDGVIYYKLALRLDENDNPIVGYTDGVNAYRATAKEWNGTSWITLGDVGSTNGYYTSVEVDAGGYPVFGFHAGPLGGKATVLRWNGSSWTAVGSAGFSAGSISAMSVERSATSLFAAYRSANGMYVKKIDLGNAPTVYNMTGNNSYCVGEAGTALGLANSESGTTYQLVKNNVPHGSLVAGTGSAISFGVQQAGVYTVTANNIAGVNTMNGSITVSQSALPSINGLPAAINSCPGSNLLLNATGNASTYSWNNGVVNNVATVSPEVTTTYICTATSTQGCVAYDTVMVNALPRPTVSIAPVALSFCAGTGVTLSATGDAVSYSWDNSVVNNTAFTPASTQTYVVTATSDSGCVAYDTVTVTVNPLPTISGVPADFDICEGSSVTLNATGDAVSYSWDNSVVNNTAFTPADTTTYVVTATSDSGCVAYDTVTINVVPMPALPSAFSVSSATVYAGQSGVLYEVTADSFSYHWSVTGSALVLNPNGHSTTLGVDISASSSVDTLKVVAFTTSSPVCSSAVLSMPVVISDEILWTGAVDSSWTNTGNWSGGYEPTVFTKVRVPAGTPVDPVIASGNQQVKAFALDAGATTTIEDLRSLDVIESLTISGTVSGEGSVVLNGSSLQTIAGNGTVANLELSNPSGATIVAGDTIHIGRSYVPTLGVLTTNGGLELLADANGTASILKPLSCSGNYIDGDVITNVFIAGGNRSFRFLGHPFSVTRSLAELTDDIDITGQQGAVNGFTTTGTNNPSSFWFDTPNGNNDSTISTGWMDFTNTNGLGTNAWEKMEAIRVMVRGVKGEGLDGQAYTPSDATIDMSGTVNQCDVTHTLSSNNNPAKRGYNLISNPYPSAVEMTALVREDSVGDAFYVWDPRAGTHGTGAYVVASFDPLVNASYVVPSHAGMFLYVKPGSLSENKITFSESMKTQDPSSSAVFKTTAGMTADGLQLQVLSHNGDVYWDKLYIRFDNQSTPMVDGRDAYKLVNPVLDFYTISGSNKLSIDVRPMVLNTAIPLGFVTDSQFQYTIKVADYNVSGTQLYLIDKYLQHAEPLSAGAEYQFTVTADPMSQGESRFEIGIGTTNAVAGVNSEKVQMYLVPNPATDRLKVSFEARKEGKTELVVRNALGQQVYSESLGRVSAGNVTVPVSNLAAGVYTVTLSAEGFTETQKFIKQ